MQIDAKPIDLRLITPFRIARTEARTVSPSVMVHLQQGNYSGLGEASPSGYYGENVQTVLNCISLFANQLGDDPFLIDDILARLEKSIRLHPSAKAAIDMSLHDIIGKQLGVPLYRLFGLNPANTPLTSFTIGIDSPSIMAQRAALAKDYPILKVKVGTKNDLENIRAIREVSKAVIRVDANGGWTPKQAIRMINELAPYNIEFVEQPTAARDLAGLKLIRDNVPLPIIADESSVTVDDIPLLADCVDGINIKLMKCGGLRHALKMISVARAHHLQIMLGCMIESSVAITAAAHLTPLVDYADLDGNLLIEYDPYEGVRVEKGKLLLPDRPGLGVRPRS